jgi:excisionase family DNA binding protein
MAEVNPTTMEADMIAEAQELVSVGETALRLGVSEQSVWRHIRSGRLPAYRVGGAVRLRGSDVARFVTPYETRTRP